MPARRSDLFDPDIPEPATLAEVEPYVRAYWAKGSPMARAHYRTVEEAIRDVTAAFLGREENPKAPWRMTREEYLNRDRLLGYWGREIEELADRVRSHDHRVHVERALRTGKPVPTEVLADYPGLRAGNPGAVKRFLGGATPKPPKRSDWPIGKALDQAYKAGLHHGDTGAFEDWLEKTGLAGRGPLLQAKLEREFRRAVEGEPERMVGYKGATISLLPDGEWSASIEPESRFDGLTEAKQFVDAALRGRNPIDMATVLAVGVLAGAVQGVVEPYVTKHVYGRGVAPMGTVANPPKPVPEMSASEINRALDKLGAVDSKLTREMIAAGRGNERPSEYLQMTDPLAMKLRAVSEQRLELQREVLSRYGPGAPSRLPPGFGPIKGRMGNPGTDDEYLIQVFSKGYLAGGEAVTPAKMHAPGIVDRYTHDPNLALRVTLDAALKMQRRYAGTFAAVPVEEALEGWRKFGRYMHGERKDNPATTYLGWPVVVIGSHRSWDKVNDLVGDDNLIELHTYDRQRSAGTGYAAIRPGKLSAALAVKAVSRASFRGKVNLHPGAEHTGRDPWPLVRRVAEEYRAAGGVPPWAEYDAGGPAGNPAKLTHAQIEEVWNAVAQYKRRDFHDWERAFNDWAYHQKLAQGFSASTPTAVENKFRDRMALARVEWRKEFLGVSNPAGNPLSEYESRMRDLHKQYEALQRKYKLAFQSGADTSDLEAKLTANAAKSKQLYDQQQAKPFRSLADVMRERANPAARFYAAPLAGNKWEIRDRVTAERIGKRTYTRAAAQAAADKLNRDWAAGKIEVIAEDGHVA